MSRYAERRQRLVASLRRVPADAALITNVTNVTYLTGFTGDDSFLLLTGRDAIVISDGRYRQQLEQECPDVSAEIRPLGTEIAAFAAGVAASARVRRLAIEARSMTVSLSEDLDAQLPRVERVATRGLVERLREIKDREEIAEIRAAIELAERAFAVLRASLRPELTEKQVAHLIEHQIRLFGGRGCSFTPIVGVGPRGALPHATLSDRCIGESPFVLIDWGAIGRLYMSDLTRVLVTAKIPPKLQRVYEVVLRAQQAAIDAIRPGAALKDVDAAARKTIQDAGYGDRFTHGLGHGIGLEIHEAPRIAGNQEGRLKAGMVVTVEPGIYIPDWGGVRIEDDILVTRGGREVLSRMTRELDDCLVA